MNIFDAMLLQREANHTVFEKKLNYINKQRIMNTIDGSIGTAYKIQYIYNLENSSKRDNSAH